MDYSGLLVRLTSEIVGIFEVEARHAVLEA
ncbi:hypothetical protein N826_07140 [Skermanella aerolata KACC 11604]|nr:hypothetical protein N826_07140 [Skermanella aerolata KACC 11604]